MKKLLGILVLVLVVGLACTALAEYTPDHGEVPSNSVVNWGDLDSITKIDGHAVGSYTVTKQPTCSEYGRAEFDCKELIDGQQYHYHVVRIAKLPHTWSSESGAKEWGKVIEEATCKKAGKAQDVCLVCGATREKYRTIEAHHSYNDDTYFVFRAPTCSAFGLGQHTCIWCGEKKADEIDKDGKPIEWMMVRIPLIDHKFSDWTVITKGTCAAYGSADRACVVCGMHQRLADDGKVDHDLYEDIDGDGIKERLLDYVKDVKKVNPGWTNYDGLTFDNEGVYEQWLDKYVKPYFEYKITKDWLKDCYTRQLTFACPHCYKDKTPAHTPFVITLTKPATIAHEWLKEKDKTLSRPATCVDDGYNIYLCKHDADHGHSAITAPGSTYEEILKQGVVFTSSDMHGGLVKVLDPQVKIEKVPALGHTWSPWEVDRTYTKDGVKYILNVRTCEVCGATEEEIKELQPGDGKNGLVLDEETGKWYYYEADQLVEKTKIIGLDTGDFWIINGELASEANGLTYCPDSKFYFLSKGQIQRVSDVVSYDEEWFKIVNGTLDLDANGLYDYNGGKFVFAVGRLRKDVNGLWQNPADGKWYFLANGQVQAVSQVVSYDGAFFVVENGVLNTGYNGTIEYDGATFNVVNGQLFPIE